MALTPNLIRRHLLLALAAMALSVTVVSAQPQGPQPWWLTQPRPLPFLHPLFSSDAVLQRDAAVPIWGWTTPGDRVRVSVDGKLAGEAAIAGIDGRWMTRIGPFPAGGPHTIVVEGKNRKVTLENILFGDVWLCTGQSNMNWPVRLATEGEAEAKRANFPAIHSFTVGFYPAIVPQVVPQSAGWEVCTPATARNFTAVGYFFARHLHETRKVPIGIIHASAGATAAEAWTSAAAALRRHMPFDFRDRLADLDKVVAAAGPDFDYFRALEKWTATVDPASAKKHYPSDPYLDTADWADIAVPKPWQDGGLKGFDGLVWFRRSIELPETWKGKDLRLSLSVVKDADVVWFNGTLVGVTQTAGTPRNYLIEAKLVKPGKNLLVAAIANKTGPGGFCSAPGQMLIQPIDLKEKPIPLAGTWKAKAAIKAGDLIPMPRPLVGNYKTITALDNGMIAPLTPFGIKGALWYQGESNWPFGPQYRRLLPTLIADWRGRFGVGDFPFLIVSLANYNSEQTKPVEPGWAELREAQWRTVRKVPNTGLAVTIDIGDANDIHPRNKQEVGRRLGLVARQVAYGEKDLVASGPEFDEMMIEKTAIRLYFKHIGGGLTVRGNQGGLTGFAIAGADKQFVWADAKVEGATIIVSSPEVTEPKHVRYGWASNPVVNLFNQEGLPAIPFRTDE